jgi:hypothetical protein
MHTPNSKLTRVTDAASEPIEVADAKNYLGVPSSITSDDGLIGDMITAARYECENINSRSFINTTWKLTLDYFPPYSSRYTSLLPPAIVGPMSDRNYWLNLSDVAISLPMPPLVSVTGITYVDPSGATRDLDVSPDAQNVTISAGTPGQITPFYGKIFPVTQPILSAVNISYLAGYGPDATTVPKNVVMASRYLVAHYYNFRTTNVEIPDRVYRLLDATNWGNY